MPRGWLAHETKSLAAVKPGEVWSADLRLKYPGSLPENKTRGMGRLEDDSGGGGGQTGVVEI